MHCTEQLLPHMFFIAYSTVWVTRFHGEVEILQSIHQQVAIVSGVLLMDLYSVVYYG